MMGRTGMRILVVDDSRTDRQYLHKILSHKGYEIIEATDGKNALSILSTEVPDLILLDVVMPGMNGFEVCNKIKGDSETADVPVIFVTSKIAHEDKIRGFEAGGADYITKPFHSEEVLARIKTHLRLNAALRTIQEYNEKLEQMLEKRTSELIKSERQAAFGQFVQGIVHNMNGPLTATMGAAQLICIYMEQLTLNQKSDTSVTSGVNTAIISNITSRLDIIRSSSNRLVKMIESLISKSRSDHSEDYEMIDLNEIIRQELDFLGADLRFKHHVSKNICLSDLHLPVYVIPSVIAQIFQNIIRNALDATYNSPDPTLIVRTGMSERGIWFSVSDNGSGIPEGIMAYIFDPFFTTKPKEKSYDEESPTGTGLGLYICQAMIKSHRGSIEVESNPETGTTFWVRLPCHANKLG